MADAIIHMSTLPDEQRRRMGAGGRSYVAANYSRSALADRYLGILTGLVNDAAR
jgi:glycosyltransferase involved in cell wall biosynthesis